MSKHDGFRNWDCHLHEDPYEKALQDHKDKIVYLSSESENVLEKFEKDHYYIIGGLVDHNNHKGLCHKLAVEKGMRHARLPIDEYVKINSRRVLAINHVFQIIGLVVSSEKSWEEAFLQILPGRKGVESKNDDDKVAL